MAKHSSNVSVVHPDVSRDVTQTGAADPAPVRSRKRAAKQGSFGRISSKRGLPSHSPHTVNCCLDFDHVRRKFQGPGSANRIEARRCIRWLWCLRRRLSP
jgi:hypothetical protein